jgi:hypothetical protein
MMELAATQKSAPADPVGDSANLGGKALNGVNGAEVGSAKTLVMPKSSPKPASGIC